ncbi:hypothetical protein JS532_04910 [Bifidobacterium callimiconis]|uniref:hypothetical protein n=1 Tax=Bifidobacterium callimiconis TaxID=2306973 RepID=UPI001BDBFB39|nr:hypothetical protein [Bifidobacterium callimiconis]MBT1176910.1 hypothetical protein [Bifidobacterium callimiconis]
MGVLDTDAIINKQENESKQRQECIDFCLQAIAEFNDAAQKVGLPLETLTVGKTPGIDSASIIPFPVEREESGGFFSHTVKEWTEFHTIVLIRHCQFDWINKLNSAVIAKNGDCYLNRSVVTPQELAEFIATIVSDSRQDAEKLFSMALQGQPFAFNR